MSTAKKTTSRLGISKLNIDPSKKSDPNTPDDRTPIKTKKSDKNLSNDKNTESKLGKLRIEDKIEEIHELFDEKKFDLDNEHLNQVV